MYSTKGQHIFVDCWGVSKEKLDNLEHITMVMAEGIGHAGAELRGVQSEKFEPNGVTVLCLLAESHFSIHTYPEKEFCAIDCYTCGSSVDPIVAVKHLLDFLQPDEYFVCGVERGIRKPFRVLSL